MNQKEINEGLQDTNINDKLILFSALIDDAIIFGKALIEWDFEKGRKGDENLPPLLFLRNILELGEAISILIKNSSIAPCKILIRSLLENTYELIYLLGTEEENKRALSFIVWDTHEDLKFYERLNSSTVKGKKFKKELGKDKFKKYINLKIDRESLIHNTQISEALLKSPKYAEMETVFQQLPPGMKKKWYSMSSGKINIDQLVKYLNLNASYEIIYREFSTSVHATNIGGKLVPNSEGTVSMIQNTHTEDAIFLTQFTITFMKMSYEKYYESRIPERGQEVNEWYLDFNKRYQELLK